MISSVLKKIVLTYCGLFLISSLFAQGQRPSWTKKMPKSTDSYIGIVQINKPTPMDTIPYNPNYKEDAVRNALLKVAAQMPWEVDTKSSLLAKLSSEGKYKVSLENVLQESMRKSPLFKLQVWENETEYWCYYSVTKKDALLYIDELLEKTAFSAQEIYEDAKLLQSEGYVYRAAQKYVEALDTLHPVIFRKIPVANDTGYVDLGHLIYEDYINVYRGIAFNTKLNSIPAVWGEAIPGTYSVNVTQNNVPLRKLGIITTFEGVVSAEPTTDDEGNCWFHIDNVTSKDKIQQIGFSIDTEYLMELPLVYGDNPLEGRNLFPSLKISVNLFEPHIYTKIDVPATDSLLYKDLVDIWQTNRNDVVLTERYDSADVAVEIEVSINKEQDIQTEKYQFIQYNAGIHLNIKSISDEKSLAEYTIKDFKITLPATRTQAQVRQSALREMARQINREFPKIVEEFKFDKREVVWRKLVSVSK